MQSPPTSRGLPDHVGLCPQLCPASCCTLTPCSVLGSPTHPLPQLLRDTLDVKDMGLGEAIQIDKGLSG